MKLDGPRLLAHAPYGVGRSLLGNGLRLVTVETPYLHTATVVVYARIGSRYETPAGNGLSHFVEHMLFRGSAGLPSSYALNLAIEQLGGTLYAETGRDYSLYQVSVNPAALPDGLAILGDLFAAPLFQEIELERQIIVEEILEDMDDRGRNVNVDEISRLLAWGDHPLGFPIGGPLKNVRRFRDGDVRRHFRQFYSARNLVLCVGGPVKHAHVEKLAARTFRAVQPGRRAVPRAPRVPLDGPRFRWVNNESAQTQVQFLFHALPERDPDSIALNVMLRILDDGMSTRLHHRVCDQAGLAYHIAGSLELFHDSALLEIDAACAPAKLPELVSQVLQIVSEFRSRPVDEAELDKAKRRFYSDLEASYDDLDSLCGWFGGTELFYRPRSQEERARRLTRVQAAQVQRVAQRVIRPERLSVAVVGIMRRPLERRVRQIVERWT